VLPALIADPRVDALIVLFVPPVVAGADEVAAAIRRVVEREQPEKPVLAAVVSGEGIPAVLREERSGVAAFSYPESAAWTLGLAAERAEWLRRPAGSEPELEGIDEDAARRLVAHVLARASEAWLEPAEARALLEAYGVPVVRERVAETVDEAVTAALELGLPAVVKSAEAGAHKTERGAVALDLATEDEVRAAVERIGLPVLVQPHVRGGAELLAGVVQDPMFGPLVAFGPGGVFAELIGDAAFRIAPLTDLDAEELVLGGKAGRLVRGFRGAPPADSAALVDLVLRLARLADDLPEVAELDLNPVIGQPDGCVAVDARIRLREHPRQHALKSW
jgi:acyl-CoA synthetase (NDP forming)